MNIVVHFLLNVLIGIGLALPPVYIAFLGLGGIIIDIDHIFYSYFIAGNHTISDMIQWHKQEDSLMRQHPYVFHFIEVLILLVIVSWFIDKRLFVLFIGFAIHVFFDMLNYLFYHKSLSGLAQFTMTYWVIK
jgi:lipid-A-disaccharide synthase-like uncharacterized protein